MWMPIGWWIITEVNNKGVRFTAGANGLKEILVDDLQKIVDANEKLVKEFKDADR